MKKLQLIFILFFFGALCNIYSQPSLPKATADSLWAVWSNPQHPDSNRLKAIHYYSWHGYIFTKPDSAFYFAQLQYDFAKAKGVKNQMAGALNTQGVSYAIRGDYGQAINYYNKSLKIQEEIGDKKGMASSLNNIGLIYSNQGNYAKAINYYTKSLEIKEKIEDKIGIAASFGNIGSVYKQQGDYAQAINYHTKSLRITEIIDDKLGIASALNNIGNIYQEQGEYVKAINHYIKSLRIREEILDKKGVATSLNNIAVIYSYQKNYVEAINYYTKSLIIREEIGDKQGVATSLNNIGIIYQEQGEYTKAINYCTKGLEIYEETENKEGIATSLNNIGLIHHEQGDYLKAMDYSQRALTIAQEIGAAIETIDAAKSLWEINKHLGKHKKALEMYELYVATRDSIESEENQKEVIRQEYKYQYEKQATADSIAFAKEQEIKEAEIAAQKAEIRTKKNQQYALYGGLLLVLIFSGFIYNRFKVSQKQKRIIESQKQTVEEKNKEITDSISYAKRIQGAILPPVKLFKQHLPESFILYKPKDIVAGDFYWLEHKDGKVLFAAADCTGHGVPGAMVSVICNNGLNRSVREYGLTEPGKILDKTREIVIQEFEKSEDEVKDGMDIALCSLHNNTLQYAGANNPLWIIRKDGEEIEEIKATKQPIGKYAEPQPYTTHTIELQKGDSIYIFSDGYADQFGGDKGKKFKAANLKKLLLSIQEKSMEEQKSIIEQRFKDWKGSLEQIDDVCVIGVRI